jgi:hypothetical protein
LIENATGTDSRDIDTSAKAYFFLALVIFLAALGALLICYGRGDFMPQSLMAGFMGFYFLFFGISKLFDIRGFAAGFARYDIIAARFKWYGSVFPFLELVISLGYFLNSYYINAVTVVITLVSSAGVARQLLKRSRLRCVCLGAGIKMPLGIVSLAENLLMAAMALYMLLMVM